MGRVVGSPSVGCVAAISVGGPSAGLLPGIVALNLGEDRAERRRQVRQRLILLRREIILVIRAALNLSADQLRANRMAHKVRRQDAAVPKPLGIVMETSPDGSRRYHWLRKTGEE